MKTIYFKIMYFFLIHVEQSSKLFFFLLHFLIYPPAYVLLRSFAFNKYIVNIYFLFVIYFISLFIWKMNKKDHLFYLFNCLIHIFMISFNWRIIGG